MTDLSKLAASLSEVHYEALMGDPNDDMPSQVALDFIAMRLVRPVSIDPPKMGWSQTGLALRDYLKEQSDV